MKALKLSDFFKGFEINGSQFVAIKGYESKTGEIANYTVNVGLSVNNAKQADLKRLLNCMNTDLLIISEKSKIDIKTCQIALTELISAAEKNLSENIEDRSNQSQAQTDTYFNLCKGIKMHKDTQNLYIFGQLISKNTIVKGEYKTVNSSPKTMAKKAITKHLNLTAGKFREFILPNISMVKMQGKAIIVI